MVGFRYIAFVLWTQEPSTTSLPIVTTIKNRSKCDTVLLKFWDMVGLNIRLTSQNKYNSIISGVLFVEEDKHKQQVSPRKCMFIYPCSYTIPTFQRKIMVISASYRRTLRYSPFRIESRLWSDSDPSIDGSVYEEGNPGNGFYRF